MSLTKVPKLESYKIPEIFANASRRHGQYLSLITAQDQSLRGRGVAIVVSSKNVPGAVKRNLLKRRLKNILSYEVANLPAKPFIISIKPSALKASFSQLNQDLISLINSRST